MEIINKSRELTGREQHKLTKGKSAQSIKEAVGLTINVDLWCVYRDENQRKEEVEVLAVMDKEGQVYTTISDVFKRSFLDIVDEFKTEVLPPIVVLEGTTRSGRTYVDCDIE